MCVFLCIFISYTWRKILKKNCEKWKYKNWKTVVKYNGTNNGKEEGETCASNYPIKNRFNGNSRWIKNVGRTKGETRLFYGVGCCLFFYAKDLYMCFSLLLWLYNYMYTYVLYAKNVGVCTEGAEQWKVSNFLFVFAWEMKVFNIISQLCRRRKWKKWHGECMSFTF